MLAKAVAAECGASFLAINPSAVASKWLGDGENCSPKSPGTGRSKESMEGKAEEAVGKRAALELGHT